MANIFSGSIQRLVQCLLISVLGLAACSSSDGALQDITEVEVTATTQPTPTTTLETTTTSTTEATTTTAESNDLPEIALDYFNGVAGFEGNVDLSLAEAESIAWAYADYLLSIREVYGVQDFGWTSSEADSVGVTYTNAETSEALRFDNVEISAAGVVGFDVNGVPMRERMTALFEGPTNDAGTLTIEQVTSYRTVSGFLLVTVRIRNNADQPFETALYDSSWVADDGRQYAPLEHRGDAIRAGAVATMILTFEGTRLTSSDGTFYLAGFYDDFSTSVSFEVPVG